MIILLSCIRDRHDPWPLTSATLAVRAAASVPMAPEPPSTVDSAAAEEQQGKDAADAKQRAADLEKEHLALC